MLKSIVKMLPRVADIVAIYKDFKNHQEGVNKAQRELSYSYQDSQ